MKLKFALAAAAATLLGAGSANAALITSIQIKNADGIPGQGYLQVAEVEAFGATGAIVPFADATATSTYDGVYNNPDAAHAIDGDTDGAYPNIYHGAADDGSDILTVSFAAPTDIRSFSSYGRTDGCCTFRDVYSYSLFDGMTLVGSGTLDATGPSNMATAAVPEPATWGMMLLGFGMLGFGLRARRRDVKVSFA